MREAGPKGIQNRLEWIGTLIDSELGKSFWFDNEDQRYHHKTELDLKIKRTRENETVNTI